MVEVQAPQDSKVLSQELGDTTMIARFKDLEIHLFSAHQAPHVMEEIGRIRELEYRREGAGRGLAKDIDFRDTQWPWYHQLVSWDPQEKELVAMYRFIPCKWAIDQGGLKPLRTSELFDFSPYFIQTVLTKSIELGRSVVNRGAKRAIQGLFSVWTGLGALIQEWPEIEYFFGNVSFYQTMPDAGLTHLIQFLQNHHGQSPGLITPKFPLPTSILNSGQLNWTGTWDKDFQILLDQAKHGSWEIPPILVSYLKANRGLGYYGTSADADFGLAWESAITVPTKNLEPKMVSRFLDPYQSINPQVFIQHRWSNTLESRETEVPKLEDQ
jgi:hypothetical protein